MAKYTNDDIYVGAILEARIYGKYEILKLFSERDKSGHLTKKASIRFINTGYTADVQLTHIRHDGIKDYRYPILYGVGYLDMPKGEAKLYNKEYKLWKNILSKCYNKKDPNYKTYGMVGVRVDERWFSFKNFLLDLPNIPGYAEWINNTIPHKYHFDKDILQLGIPNHMKIYSNTTCMFVEAVDNMNEVQIRTKQEKYKNTYFGVYNSYADYYSVHVNIHNKVSYLGLFSSELAAAVYREYYINIHNLINMRNFNNQQYPMSLYDAISCKIRKEDPKQMCHIVEKPEKRVMCRIVDKG